MEKEIDIELKIDYYSSFWSKLLALQFNDITVDQLYSEIKNDKNIVGSSKYLLNNILKVKSNELTVRKFQDIIRDDIYKIEFQLRDIYDAKKNIIREVFNPEKLIGKTIVFKPYPVKKFEEFKILSIDSHYCRKEKNDKGWFVYPKGQDMVVYGISGDAVKKFGNKFPIHQTIIQSLINEGSYMDDYLRKYNLILQYKLVNN